MRLNGSETTSWTGAAFEGFHVSREAVRKADPKDILHSGQLHPELVRRAERLIEKASSQGFNLYVFEGYRSMERQAQLLAGGKGVTNAKPGNSFHNYGLAVDIVFKDAQGRPSWSESHDWQTLGRLGKEEGLVWGGDWKKPVDRSHFQLVPNDQISTVRKLTGEIGIEKMWDKIR